MNSLKYIIPVIGGVAVAVRIDLRTFSEARKLEPDTRFDWALFTARAVDGAIGGFLMAAGIGATEAAIQ